MGERIVTDGNGVGISRLSSSSNNIDMTNESARGDIDFDSYFQN